MEDLRLVWRLLQGLKEAGGLVYGSGSKREMNGVKAISEVEMVELGDELNEVNEILIC